MSRKHFLLYDFLLPLAVILLIGRFLADRFDGALFHRIDSIKAFGLDVIEGALDAAARASMTNRRKHDDGRGSR